jgi:predicted nucleotidyltransferase
MNEFHSRAKDIFNIDENKIAVLGYFHNPHVIFELMRSVPDYKAVKIGREDYKIKTGGKEYVFLYTARNQNQEEVIDSVINTYPLNNHVIVSATYDLNFLNERGFKTKTFNILKTIN